MVGLDGEIANVLSMSSTVIGEPYGTVGAQRGGNGRAGQDRGRATSAEALAFFKKADHKKE